MFYFLLIVSQYEGAINPKKLIPPTTEIADPANITAKISNSILIVLTFKPSAVATASPRFNTSN